MGHQVQTYKEITGRLPQLANKVQDLQDRADRVSHTMNKIRGIIGDQNADSAEVFAPLETPRYVQSLAEGLHVASGRARRPGDASRA